MAAWILFTGLSPSLAPLSSRFYYPHYSRMSVPQPSDSPLRDHRSLGSSLFARRYWGNHSCFLFLRLLRCFSSARTLSAGIYSHRTVRRNVGLVNLFGNLGITASWQLPQAYRNHVRPSSVLSSKASTVCINVEYFLLFKI